MISQSYLLLGSNQGNKLSILGLAVKRLQELSDSQVNLSHVFESEPWGFETDEWFVNQAIKIETRLAPPELLKAVMDIERDMGRVRLNSIYENKRESGITYSSRTLDIDILLYDNQIIETKELVVPHPKMHLRMFALKPLSEIAPTLVHPVLSMSIRELMEHCEDTLIVRKIKN